MNFATLTEDRIRDAASLAVTGIDLAGSLSKNISYSVPSLSTDKFLRTLRRFIAGRGRPEIIFSDNDKNFIGTNLALQKINWDQVMSDGTVKRINNWKFVLPFSPWWEGW